MPTADDVDKLSITWLDDVGMPCHFMWWRKKYLTEKMGTYVCTHDPAKKYWE